MKARRRLYEDSGRQHGTVVPLYHQVYVVLRERIRDGGIDTARPLPGEHQLAEEFGVSRVTIRRTLQILELEGLVERRRGVGTFAVPNPVEFRDRYDLGGLLRPGAGPDAATASRDLRTAEIDPPAQVARAFGGPERVLLVERLRHHRGEPFTLLAAYLPLRVARDVGRGALQNTAVLTAVERAGFHLARTEQAISAEAADERVARHLDLPIGAPVIYMTSLFSDEDDNPVALLEGRYRPDRYEYRTTMVRSGRGATARWRPLL